VQRYVAAFATLQKARSIVVGSDSRVSGPWVRNVVHGVLGAMGCNVIEVGVVPTPTVQLLTTHYNADGGLVITSSHNPVEWNGLKFVDRDGLFLSPAGCSRMFALADSGTFPFAAYNALGSVRVTSDAIDVHVRAILSLEFAKVEQVRARRFKVCLDTVNGAGGPIMRRLLESLHCEVVSINEEPTGLFAHKPEPIPEHLGDLCALVKQHGAHLGIATDPDVDRCVLIDETGVPLGEEYTLALAVELVLGKCGKRGAVVRNLSSSRANDDIARRYGCPVYATAVGEINVAVKMVEVKAVIGGEGNGGVMLPDVHIGRDAPVAAALTLAHLAVSGNVSLSALKRTLPQYEIVKLKAPIAGIDPEAVIARIRSEWSGKPDVRLDEVDGLRIDYDGASPWWVHLRKSNTEPIVRVIGEAATRTEAERVCTQFMNRIIELSRK